MTATAVPLGLVVAGGPSPFGTFAPLDDAALTPFAGAYRFVDFALATLGNSGVKTVWVATPRPGAALRAHLTAARRGRFARLGIVAQRPDLGSRAARLRAALVAAGAVAGTADTIALLSADHVLNVDLRQLVAAHRDLGADVTVAALPFGLDAVESRPLGRTVLDVTAEHRVRAVQHAPVVPATAPGTRSAGYTWAGDLMLRASALPALLEAVGDAPELSDAAFLGAAVSTLRVCAFDVLAGHLPGTPERTPTYWHEPTSVEAYYEAQMELCSARPPFELHNPAWPVAPAPTGLGPARVVCDPAGRLGQVVNALVADGAVIRGGVAANTVVGHAVVIESGAEVEDAVLLAGCRIGRGARVRRAVVGPGAVVGGGGAVGWDAPPPAGCEVLPSGLTLVSAAPAVVGR
jgi:glucose-1-phosphate adenylyltransferase